MIRILATAIIIIFVSSLFIGCGTKEENFTTITIWHDKEDEVVAALQAELDKLAPEIIVDLERKSGLTESLKMVGNDPNAAPDMYLFAHDKIGVYAEMGILSPITNFIPKEKLDDYIDITVKAASYKGETYQLPIYFETLLFMYNKEYMTDDEVPKTTDELFLYMQRNTVGGRYGFVEQHSTAYYSTGWIHGFGGYVINENGEAGLDSQETIDALSYHLKFVKLMPGESEYSTVNTLFREGMADATIGGPWMVPTAREAGIDLGLAPMPIVNETGLPIAPYTGVQGVHVLKVAEQRKHDEIVKVLQVLMNKEIGIALAKESGCAPALESCYLEDDIINDDMVMIMKNVAEKSVPMPNIPEMDVMWTVTSNLLVDINMSKAEVNESCQKAQEQANDLIAAMK